MIRSSNPDWRISNNIFSNSLSVLFSDPQIPRRLKLLPLPLTMPLIKKIEAVNSTNIFLRFCPIALGLNAKPWSKILEVSDVGPDVQNKLLQPSLERIKGMRLVNFPTWIALLWHTWYVVNKFWFLRKVLEFLFYRNTRENPDGINM